MDTVVVDRAGIWDAESLSVVAAQTFPLACPPDVTSDDIDAYLRQTLSTDRFGEYLVDSSRLVLKATDNTGIVGYAMLIDGEPDDPAQASVVAARPALELSKLYVLPGHHGAGVSAALMDATLAHAAEQGFACVWLGVNQSNTRAQRFYRRHGFDVVGTRAFPVGNQSHDDYLMRKTLS